MNSEDKERLEPLLEKKRELELDVVKMDPAKFLTLQPSEEWIVEQDKLRMIKAQHLSEVEAEIAEIRSPTEPVEPIQWKGTARAWGLWVQEAFDQGQVNAKSLDDALKQTAKHFVDKDGHEFKPRSVRSNLYNKALEETP